MWEFDFYMEISYLMLYWQYCMPQKIIASFYKVQYELIKLEMWHAVYVCLFPISRGMFLPRIGKIGDIWRYNRHKMVTVY